MKNRDRRIKAMLICMIIILILPMIYLSYFTMFTAEKIVDNPYNKRNLSLDQSVVRGKFLDRNGVVLASSEAVGENYNRVYSDPYLYSHIIGYNSKIYSRSGLEKTYNKQLSGQLDSQTITAVMKFFNKGLYGNDIVLTIDNQLMEKASNLLGDRKGAVVVSKADTGEILAAVSKPQFNLSGVDSNWNDLVNSSDSPLLNRAFQGLYAPGSVYKIVSSLLVIEEGRDFEYIDTGKETVDGYTFTNSGGKSYGKINLSDAFTYSVNTYFVNKLHNMKKDVYNFVTHNLSLDKVYDSGLDTAKNRISIDFNSKTELASSAIGQGKILVSPLAVNLMTNVIANEGKLMCPMVVKSIKSYGGNVIRNYSPKQALISKIPLQEIDIIRQMMRRVVSDGTASSINRSYEIYGKTGTAENSKGTTDAWFTGFSKIGNSTFSVTVLVEDSSGGGGSVAAPIAAKILDQISGKYK